MNEQLETIAYLNSHGGPNGETEVSFCKDYGAAYVIELCDKSEAEEIINDLKAKLQKLESRDKTPPIGWISENSEIFSGRVPVVAEEIFLKRFDIGMVPLFGSKSWAEEDISLYTNLAKAVGNAGYHINSKNGQIYLSKKQDNKTDSISSAEYKIILAHYNSIPILINAVKTMPNSAKILAEWDAARQKLSQ